MRCVVPLPTWFETVSFKETQVSFWLSSPHLPHFNYHNDNNEIKLLINSEKRDIDLKRKEEYLEEIGEVRVIAATLGLKIGEVFKVSSDHQQIVHHFSFS